MNNTMLHLALAELITRWRSSLGMVLVIALPLLSFLLFDAYQAGFAVIFSGFDPAEMVVQSMGSMGELYGSRLPVELASELQKRGARMITPEIHTVVGSTPANAMLLRGISLDRYLRIEGLRILLGRPFQPGEAPRKAMVGARLAEQRELTPGALVEIRGRSFQVVGIFEIGTYEDHEIWISLQDAQDLLGWGSDVSVFIVPANQGLRPGDVLPAGAVVTAKGDNSADLVNEWSPLFNLLRAVAVALGVAAVVALANLLWRLAWQRRREIAVLRSLGFGRRALSIYLLGQAFAITGLGFVLGASVALVLSAITRADAIGITLQAHFNPRVIATGLALALIIALAGSILPAVQLSRLNLASLLRDE